MMAKEEKLMEQLRDSPQTLLAELTERDDDFEELRRFLVAEATDGAKQRAEKLWEVADARRRTLITRALETAISSDRRLMLGLAAAVVILAAIAAFFGIGPILHAIKTSSFRSYMEGRGLHGLALFVAAPLAFLFSLGYAITAKEISTNRATILGLEGRPGKVHTHVWFHLSLALCVAVALPIGAIGGFSWANWPRLQLPDGWVYLEDRSLASRRSELKLAGDLLISARDMGGSTLDVLRTAMTEVRGDLLSFDELFQWRLQAAKQLNRSEGFVEVAGNRFVRMSVGRQELDGEEVLRVQTWAVSGGTAIGYQFRARGFEYSVNFIYDSEGVANIEDENRSLVISSIF